MSSYAPGLPRSLDELAGSSLGASVGGDVGATVMGGGGGSVPMDALSLSDPAAKTTFPIARAVH